MDDNKKKKRIEDGVEGERKVNSVLKKFLPGDEYHLIEDVTLPFKIDGEEISAQIDHVVVSRYGIFVIETKHWSPGSIAWRGAYPKKQNERHIKALIQCLDSEPDSFFSLCVVIPKKPYTKKLPKGTISLEQLIPEIKSKTTELFDEQKVTDIFARIEGRRSMPGPGTNEKHITIIKRSNRNRQMPKKSRIDIETETAKSNQLKNLIKTAGIGALLFLIFLGVLFYLNTKLNVGAINPLAKEIIQQILPKEVVSTEADDGADDEIVGEQFRAQFMEQLAKYESEVEPNIEEIHLKLWGEEKYAELQDLKDRALADFAKSEYLSARENLRQARALAAEAAVEYAERLEAAKVEAREAFQQDRVSEAEQAVGDALGLNPDDGEMLGLQKRIVVMHQVLDLLRQAAIAQNENRPEKEAVALQKALSIDPSRKAAESRLKEVQAQLTQQRFAGAIRKAQRALDADNLTIAEQQIALAKTISPASADPGILLSRLAKARTKKAFEAQLSLGEQAKARDDWATAEAHFQRARQFMPDDKSAVENHDFARRVTDTTGQIRTKLDQHQRLGDQSVLDSVAAYLRETATLVEVSPNLGKIHAELVRTVEAYQTEVEVVVVSDNATHIIVRGEGQVGKTLRRTIRLRPGKRVFEGARSGYQSKLVTLNIMPGALTAEVTVICDEKI